MRNIITSALLLVLSFQYIEGSAQVTKSNNIQGVYNGSSDMKTLNFGAADFGANPTIDKVTVLIEFSSQDNGTFGLTFHEDIAFRLESPMGTTVDLVYDVRGFFTGNASQQVTYGGFDPTSTFKLLLMIQLHNLFYRAQMGIQQPEFILLLNRFQFLIMNHQ